jgi:hypothetical protein
MIHFFLNVMKLNFERKKSCIFTNFGKIWQVFDQTLRFFPNPAFEHYTNQITSTLKSLSFELKSGAIKGSFLMTRSKITDAF